MNELKKYKIFTYLIIFFSLYNPTKSYIILPFKIHNPNDYSNITKLFNELLDNKLIITLPFGSQKTNMDFYASMNEYILFRKMPKRQY